MKLIYEIFIITTLFLAICLIYSGQQRIPVNNGKGIDGAFYYNMAAQFNQGINPVVERMPYIKRVGTPFLVSIYSKISGTDLLKSSLFVNLTAIFITVILLSFWLKIFIEVFWIRLLLCFVFMMTWHVPLRFTIYYPMLSDAWAAVWFMGGLLLIHYIRKSSDDNSKTKYLYLLAFSFITAIGSLFRETNAVLAIVVFLIINPFKNLGISSKNMTISYLFQTIKKIVNLYSLKPNLILFLPAIMVILINLIATNFIEIKPHDYSYIRAVFYWFYKKSLPEFLLAIFISYGPLILLIPFFFRQYKLFLFERQEMPTILILALFFSLTGGSNTERVFFMFSFPVIFVLIGLSIKDIFNSSQRWWLYILLGLQTIACRFYWSIPVLSVEKKFFPFFSLIGSDFSDSYLYSNYGGTILNSVLLFQYIFLLIITWYILHNKVNFRFLWRKKNI